VSALLFPRAVLPRSVLTLVAGVLLAACGGLASTPITTPAPIATVAPAATPAPTLSPAFPMTVTDDEGTAVTIPARPVAIVSLTPAATETLFAIGASSQVVAKVEDITPYPPEADQLPVVATYKGVDIEKIVTLNADLVIAGGRHREHRARHRQRGGGDDAPPVHAG